MINIEVKFEVPDKAAFDAEAYRSRFEDRARNVERKRGLTPNALSVVGMDGRPQYNEAEGFWFVRAYLQEQSP